MQGVACLTSRPTPIPDRSRRRQPGAPLSRCAAEASHGIGAVPVPTVSSLTRELHQYQDDAAQGRAVLIASRLGLSPSYVSAVRQLQAIKHFTLCVRESGGRTAP